MVEGTGFLPGLSPVCGKPVQVAIDGGRLSSDAGVLLLAEVERKLGIAERLARCVADPRAPEQIEHSVAEMIRFRALAIAAGYPDAKTAMRCAGTPPSRWRSAACPRRASISARSRR